MVKCEGRDDLTQGMEAITIEAQDGQSFWSALDRACTPSAQRQPPSAGVHPSVPQASTKSLVVPNGKGACVPPAQRQTPAAAVSPSVPRNSATSLVVPRGNGARAVDEEREGELGGTAQDAERAKLQHDATERALAEPVGRC